jgi:hypothetical protein
MELNHQIKLCRASPFLFGFRAIFHTTRRGSNEKRFRKFVYRAIQLANYSCDSLCSTSLNLSPERVDDRSIENRKPWKQNRVEPKIVHSPESNLLSSLWSS